MATNILIPDALMDEMLLWAAEDRMPSKFFWVLDGLDEQKWWDALALKRCILEATDVREWPD